jgi:hypothetical protein
LKVRLDTAGGCTNVKDMRSGELLNQEERHVDNDMMGKLP